MASQASRNLVRQLLFVFTLKVNKKTSILRAQKWKWLTSLSNIFSSVCFKDCHSNISLFKTSLICLHEADQEVEIQPSRMSHSRKNLAFDLFLCSMLRGKCFISQSKKVFKRWKSVFNVRGKKKNKTKHQIKQTKKNPKQLWNLAKKEKGFFLGGICFIKLFSLNE